MALYFKETVMENPVLMRNLGEGHPMEVWCSWPRQWVPTINQSTDELDPITEKEAQQLKPAAF